MNFKKGDKEYYLPDDLKYVKSHQWARVEGDIVVVGITDYAQKTLKEVIFVEYSQDVGDTTEAVQFDGDEPTTEPYGSVESTKGVSLVYSPVSGEIVEKNEALEDDPEPINSDCYGEGWMIKVKPSNLDADLANAQSAEEHAEWLKTL
ncbi:MAG: glycine cleavage system protein H [Candidatus Helarchaeota archaeon]